MPRSLFPGLKILDIYHLPGRSDKRTLSRRDKEILYERAKGCCENPICSRGKISFTEMHVGHKKAACKHGKATLRNSVCVCMRCNNLQGTDSWQTFMRKVGKPGTRSVTSGKKRKTRKRKTKKKIWINSITGKRGSTRPLIELPRL